MSDAAYLKVALATNDLITVDAPFISARQIVFYGVTGKDTQFLGLHQFKGGKPKETAVGDAAVAGAANDPAAGGKKGRCCGSVESAYGGSIEARVGLLSGCSVLFTLGLSDPQAVVQAGGAEVVAVLHDNQPVFYVLSPQGWNALQGLAPQAPAAPAAAPVAATA